MPVVLLVLKALLSHWEPVCPHPCLEISSPGLHANSRPPHPSHPWDCLHCSCRNRDFIPVALPSTRCDPGQVLYSSPRLFFSAAEPGLRRCSARGSPCYLLLSHLLTCLAPDCVNSVASRPLLAPARSVAFFPLTLTLPFWTPLLGPPPSGSISWVLPDTPKPALSSLW